MSHVFCLLCVLFVVGFLLCLQFMFLLASFTFWWHTARQPIQQQIIQRPAHEQKAELKLMPLQKSLWISVDCS